MSRQQHPGDRRLVEKLLILNDRGIGVLTRVYNIKKACSDIKSKPNFLNDKSLESCIKLIIRRFPNLDLKNLQPVKDIRENIVKSLSLYYNTFVDLLDFKDHASELLTSIDALQIFFDITINFDLTKAYFDLFTTYVTSIILLSRVDDRKAVLGLYNAAYESINGQVDQSFPRLGQMIIDYELPLKKLSEEFIPHSKLLINALMSLLPIYLARNTTADVWRSEQKLSLISNPNKIIKPNESDKMSCEYLSLEAMEKWIIFGFTLCYQGLQQEHANKMYISALESSWVITLFRDEVIYIHQFIQTFFENVKGYGKKISEIKECCNVAVQKASHKHRERRKFLRTALKELGLLFSDQPGLLGPKALLVFIALCYARDEVLWFIRHNEHQPPQKIKGRLSEDILTDRQLPELLFHIEELRMLVKKYSQILQTYYTQYLVNFDSIALKHMMQNLQYCPEDESLILSSICKQIGSINLSKFDGSNDCVDSVNTNNIVNNTTIGSTGSGTGINTTTNTTGSGTNMNTNLIDTNSVLEFNAVRLDWMRLQAFMSVHKAPMSILEHKDLAQFLDGVMFHTKMIDHFDKILTDTSDLSIFCFYNRKFEEQFHLCLEYPGQNRYIIAFPIICGHFQNSTHPLCPEERYFIHERSLYTVNLFLDEMAKEAKNIITAICDEQCKLSDQLLPKYALINRNFVTNRKKKDAIASSLSASKNDHQFENNLPGSESYRRTREDLKQMDKFHMAVSELCYAINYTNSIHVWDHTFNPKEYLYQHLENRFLQALGGMAMCNLDANEIAKPTELLASIYTYMSVLQSVENFVQIDMSRIFNFVLLQHTQQVDYTGDKTITALYIQFYSEVLLRRVSNGNIGFSRTQKSFISLSPEGTIPFNAEEYSDINELRALAELIGPYGIKLLNETLMWHVACHVQELKKITINNKDILVAIRANFNKPDIFREYCKRLTNVDGILQRMTITGVILSFRQHVQECLSDVLEQRIPFVYNSIKTIYKNHNEEPPKSAKEMVSAAGLQCKIDPILVNALKNCKSDFENEDEHFISGLLVLLVAVSIPRLARNEHSIYKPTMDGHANNIHCIATAVHQIFTAMFAICNKGDVYIEDNMKEFLALTTLCLLRLGQETDKEAIRNRDSVYLLLTHIIEESSFLTIDMLETCFPYALIRNSFHDVYKLDDIL